MSDVVVSADTLFLSEVMSNVGNFSILNIKLLGAAPFFQEMRGVAMMRKLFLAHQITQLALVAGSGSGLFKNRRVLTRCYWW